MKLRNLLWVALATFALLWIGRRSAHWGWMNSADPNRDAAVSGHEEHAVMDAGHGSEARSWTCPMHPQIKLPDPGPCPICGMDLVQNGIEFDAEDRQLVMSPASKELAQIRVDPVRRKHVTRSVRMVGKVDFDETVVRTISAWVPGRLDRLYVDYTGVRVNKGDHLVRLYSPDLLTAQEELLAARARLSSTEQESSAFLATSNRRAFETAREKLLLWGLTEEQVTALGERGTAEDHVMLTSPSSGVVIRKFVEEGAYVKTGTNIYQIADLSSLWVRLDAYEQDLSWLRYGQSVDFEVEAMPGTRFEGRISYIDPVIDEHTRTAKVRVNVDNSNGLLKPGMFVHAVANARLGAGGVVLDRSLAGKWVGPMHPEIVMDAPGQCDICGMDLVAAEELGLVATTPPGGELPLVVPHSAVLITGKRAVVYVEVPDAERPTYEGREVTLGPRAGDEYPVLSGLEEGELVVVNGAFRIDSSMQILAKPSMMGMPAEGQERAEHGDHESDVGIPASTTSSPLTTPPSSNDPAEEGTPGSLEPPTPTANVFRHYLEIQEHLAEDEAGPARRSLDALLRTVVDAAESDGQRSEVREQLEQMASKLRETGNIQELEGLRAAFGQLSAHLIAIEATLGNPTQTELHVISCPMAFDDAGANWIQGAGPIANPYMGGAMLRCGQVTRVCEPH